jgi:hypothetical protein
MGLKCVEGRTCVPLLFLTSEDTTEKRITMSNITMFAAATSKLQMHSRSAIDSRLRASLSAEIE